MKGFSVFKKFIALTISANAAFAYVSFWTYSLKLNYKEYQNGVVIDRDYSNLGDIIGIGMKYKNHFENLKIYLKGEYAAGKSVYVGQTWNRVPITDTQNNFYLWNVESGFGNRGFYLILGYRYWNRGKSDSPSDYDEDYYWGYYGIKYTFSWEFKKILFAPSVSYFSALNPKMTAKLYGTHTYDLGNTDGANVILPFYYKEGNLAFKIYYKWEYWHIRPSNIVVIQTDTKTLYTQEPESITENQYFGLGVVYSF